jgi:hypothetical protein
VEQSCLDRQGGVRQADAGAKHGGFPTSRASTLVAAPPGGSCLLGVSLARAVARVRIAHRATFGGAMSVQLIDSLRVLWGLVPNTSHQRTRATLDYTVKSKGFGARAAELNR